MRTPTEITGYAIFKYSELKKQFINEKKKIDPDYKLTDKDGAELNEQFYNVLLEQFEEPFLPVDPKKLEQAYQQKVPSFRRTTDSEFAERKAKRLRALESYTKSFVRLTGFMPGAGDYTPSRQEQRTCRIFTEDEMAKYVDFHNKMEKSYYNPNEYTEEQIKENIAAAEKDQKRLLFNALKRTTDEFSVYAEKGLSDEELIQKFPDMVSALRVIIEGVKLVGDIRKVIDDEKTLEEMAEYEKKITALMAPAVMFEKRMAIMSDHYYPFVNAEVMLDASPAQLEDLNFEKEELLNKVGVKTNGTDPYEVPEDGADFENGMVANNPLNDTVILESTEGLMFGDEFYHKDNMLILPGEITFGKGFELEEDLAKGLGMPYLEVQNNMVFCDKDGNTIPASGSVRQYILDTDGEFYVMSKFGDGQPIPVFVDKTADKFELLIGSDAIKKAKTPELPSEPKLGFWGNIISKIGISTPGIRKYNADKAKYDAAVAANERQKAMAEGRLPDVVKKNMDDFIAKNRSLSGDLSARVKRAENDLLLMQNLPEGDPTMLENILAEALINKALSEPLDSPLRKTVINMYNSLNAKFDEANAVDKLPKTDQFREFLSRVQRDTPALVAKLTSKNMEEQKIALDAIGGEFAKYFDVKEPFKKPLSAEYKKLKADRDTARKARLDVKPGEAVDENKKIKMAKEYDNASYWDSIQAMYGGERRLRSDWVDEVSGNSIYNVDDWRLMQETAVDVKSLNPDLGPMDEKTFASLNMMLSYRKKDFFVPENMKTDTKVPETMPFEDIVSVENGPRYNTRAIIRPIVEPTRKKLLKNLAAFNTIPEGETKTGKELIAKDLADALHLYVDSLKGFAWNNRQNSVLTDVGQKVFDFAEKHNMLGALKENGLSDKEIEYIRVAGALGKLINEGYNAEYDLARDCDGSRPLSDEQRLDCLNKIMRTRAIEADINAGKVVNNAGVFELPVKGENEDPQAYSARVSQAMIEYSAKIQTENEAAHKGFSDRLVNLLDGGQKLEELSNRMMPAEKREALVKGGSLAVYKAVSDKESASMVGRMVDELQGKKPEENARNTVIDDFKKRLDGLREKEEFKAVAEAAGEVLKSGSPESKSFLTKLSDDNLKKLNDYLVQHPGTDLNEGIKAFSDEEKAKAAQLKQGAPAQRNVQQPEANQANGPAV